MEKLEKFGGKIDPKSKAGFITCETCHIKSPEPTEDGECPNCRSGKWVWGKSKKLTPQDIQFKRLELGSFNLLDGELVAEDLRQHPKLWKSFVFGRFQYGELIELRDLADGFLRTELINADTLYLLVPKATLDELALLIAGWKADEVGYAWREKDGKYTTKGVIGEDDWEMLGGVYGEELVLVRVWWD